MIISTTRGKPFSVFFMLFNFFTFWWLKLLLLDKVNGDRYSALLFLVLVVLSLIAGLVYILLHMLFTYKMDKDTMSVASPISQYDCSFYDDYFVKCILELKDNACDVYFNETYFIMYQRHYNRARYVSELKSRLVNLDKSDLRYIYLYKYISVLVMSVTYYFIWQVCYSILEMGGTLFTQVITMLFTTSMLVAVFYVIDFMCCICCIIVLKKRNLEFFVSD